MLPTPLAVDPRLVSSVTSSRDEKSHLVSPISSATAGTVESLSREVDADEEYSLLSSLDDVHAPTAKLTRTKTDQDGRNLYRC